MNFIKENIKKLKPYQAGKSIEEVKEQYQLKDVVKLGSNENPIGVSPKALEAMTKALVNSSIYPDGSSRKLVEGLSQHYGVESSCIIPGNGSDEILLLIIAAVLHKGDKVLVAEKTFSQYERITEIFEGEVERVSLKQHQYDLQAFAKKASIETKIIFLCNPNNPTGTYFSHKELYEFLKKIPPTCLVVLDEAYAEFATADDFPQSIPLLKEFGNLLICRTFSKLYALAGLRVGYAIGSEPMIEGMKRVQNFNPFNVNHIAQVGATVALQDNDFVKKSLMLVQKGKKQIEMGFQSLGVEWLPTEGNFICFKTGMKGKELGALLLKKGVIIRPLQSFGMPYYSRVTIGTEEQNIRFLLALEAVIKG